MAKRFTFLISLRMKVITTLILLVCLYGVVSNLLTYEYSLIFGVTLSVVAGLIIAGRVVVPIKKLIEGTRHIASGDLRYKVSVKGSDEIKELADSFNKMGSNL